MFKWRLYFGMFAVKGRVPGINLDTVKKIICEHHSRKYPLKKSEDWTVNVLKSWMEKFWSKLIYSIIFCYYYYLANLSL